MEKSLKVNVEIIINKAKAGLADIQSSIEKVNQSFSKMSAASDKGAGGVVTSANKSAGAIKGFFNQTTTDFVKGLASYDLLKKAATTVFHTIQDGVQGALGDLKQMGQARSILESIGQSWEKVGGQIGTFAEGLRGFGFDAEDTTLAVAKFSKLTGGDLTKAMDAAKMAATATANGFGSFQENIDSFSKILAGRGTREMLKFNAVVKDGATVAEQMEAVQKSMAVTLEASANTIDGKMRIVNQSVKDAKDALGKGLVVSIQQVLQQTGILGANLKISENALHAFTKAGYQVGSAFGVMFQGIKVIVGGLRGLTDALAFGAAKWNEWAATANAALEKAKGPWSDDTIVKSLEQQKKEFKEAGDILKGDLVRDMDAATAGMEGLKDAWKAMKGEGMDAALKAVDDANTKLNVYAGTAGMTADEIDEMTKSQKQSAQLMDDLGSAYTDITQKQQQFGLNSIEDFKRFGNLLLDTKMKQQEWTKAVGTGFDAFSGKIKDVNNDISSLNKKLDDAKQSFKEFLQQTAAQGASDFATIVHDAERAIPDLVNQLDKARAQPGDQQDPEEIASLQKQIQEKQGILQTFSQQRFQQDKALMDDLAFLRQQDGRNELEQAVANMERKIEIKRQESDAEIAEIEKQIAAKERERDTFLLAQQAMSIIFQQAVAARQKTAHVEMQNLQDLATSVYSAANAYITLANSARSASNAAITANNASATIKTRAVGGPVNAGESYLVGEKGPELFVPRTGGTIVPSDKVSASGGQTVININNPVVRSDSDIQEIVRGVEEALSRRDELASMGAFK